MIKFVQNPNNMAALKEDHKELIVKLLARYYRPAEIIELFREEYEIELPRRQLTYYNPENKHGQKLSAKLKKLFYDERARYRQAEPATASAIRDVRLRKLERMAEIAMKTAEKLAVEPKLKVQSLNIMLERAQSMLEQIRVETDRLQPTHPNGQGNSERKAQLLAIFGINPLQPTQRSDPNDISALIQGGDNGHPES